MKKYPIIKQIDDYYMIYYEDKTVNIQRKQIYLASQTPIMGHEKTVIMLCDKITGKD